MARGSGVQEAAVALGARETDWLAQIDKSTMEKGVAQALVAISQSRLQAKEEEALPLLTEVARLRALLQGMQAEVRPKP